MKQIEAICRECKQPFWVDVEEEAIDSPLTARLKSILTCNRCYDLIVSKRRSQFFAQQRPKDGTLPF